MTKRSGNVIPFRLRATVPERPDPTAAPAGVVAFRPVLIAITFDPGAPPAESACARVARYFRKVAAEREARR